MGHEALAGMRGQRLCGSGFGVQSCPIGDFGVAASVRRGSFVEAPNSCLRRIETGARE